MMMTLNLANEYDFCKFKGVVRTLFLEERLRFKKKKTVKLDTKNGPGDTLFA